MNAVHIPVLVDEILDLLEGEKKKIIVDGTFGGGGHTVAMLEKFPGISVIGLDLDDDALHRGRPLMDAFPGRLTLRKSNYRFFDDVLDAEGVNRIDCIIIDLGISSDLLDDAERGFSFQKDGPLDMRLDKENGVNASLIVNGATKEELARIFFELGEERYARKIAAAITDHRRRKKIETTAELADLIGRIVGRRGKIHPATRVFQALRIAVNDELGALREFLDKAPLRLAPGGRIMVISFHSLEDRIVKNVFRAQDQAGTVKIITRKPVVASREEVRRNPRARSAKLRVAEKIC